MNAPCPSSRLPPPTTRATLATRSHSASLSSFFFNDTPTTEIYTLSLHDALPIWTRSPLRGTQRLLPRCVRKAFPVPRGNRLRSARFPPPPKGPGPRLAQPPPPPGTRVPRP